LCFFKQIVRGLTIIYALIFNFTLKCINFHTRVCVFVCEALWWLKNTFWKVESIILPVLVKELTSQILPLILPACACQGKRLTVEKNLMNVITLIMSSSILSMICNYWQGFNNHSRRWYIVQIDWRNRRLTHLINLDFLVDAIPSNMDSNCFISQLGR